MFLEVTGSKKVGSKKKAKAKSRTLVKRPIYPCGNCFSFYLIVSSTSYFSLHTSEKGIILMTKKAHSKTAEIIENHNGNTINE